VPVPRELYPVSSYAGPSRDGWELVRKVEPREPAGVAPCA
jgi:hypothetical protein